MQRMIRMGHKMYRAFCSKSFTCQQFHQVLIVKLLRKISNLIELFKCRFLYFYPNYFNETFHAYEKQRWKLKWKLKVNGCFSLKFEIFHGCFMNIAQNVWQHLWHKLPAGLLSPGVVNSSPDDWHCFHNELRVKIILKLKI